MPAFAALLRAVNVGGTGKLPMAVLKGACEAAGFSDVQTHLASGNAVFATVLSEGEATAALDRQLRAATGRSFDVLLRSGAELEALVTRNPFAGAPGDKVMVLFLQAPLPGDLQNRVRGQADEVLVPQGRDLFIHYPTGQGRSKLRLPSEVTGTARNMNTVAALAAMAQRLTQARGAG